MSTEEKSVEMVRDATKGLRERSGKKMGIVRCPTFRCLGILGKDGVWRDSHNRPLDVLEVVTEF